jgi:hypothetical protein
LVQLKVDCEYTQLYRDHLNERLTIFAVARAVVSVGALGAWISGHGYPQLWATVIVISQVCEAALTKLPFVTRERGLRAFSIALDGIFIDALLEWEDLQVHSVEAKEITRRWHTLMRLRHEAETKNVTVGLPVKRRLFLMAEASAASYIEATYGTRGL